jgi:zinc transport system ATP-binding protein
MIAGAGQKNEEAPPVQFQNVNFSFGSVPVIEDATFAIERHSLISMIGPNGGGKTTLLKLMLGLFQPDSGSVKMFGARPQRARRRIGYTPQHAQYDPQFPITVLETVMMGRLSQRLIGFYSQQDRNIAERALEEVGVAELSDRAFSDLSGGQRQRVLIARALACEPELLLLDEPTSNADVAVETRLIDTLQQLNERMTILMVSHDLSIVSSAVKRVICVNRRVAVHPTSELSGDLIKDMYGADNRIVRHDA